MDFVFRSSWLVPMSKKMAVQDRLNSLVSSPAAMTPCPIRLILLALVSSGTAVRKRCFCNHDSSKLHRTKRKTRRDSPPDHQQFFVIIQPAIATILGVIGLRSLDHFTATEADGRDPCVWEREALAGKALSHGWRCRILPLACIFGFRYGQGHESTCSTATVNCREYYWKCN